jgi:uncharacterized protein (DUF362 family)
LDISLIRNKQKLSFVKFISFHEGEDERTLLHLREIYCNNDRMASSIRELIKGELTAQLVTGKKVLLKPNWVKHSAKSVDDLCLRTNSSFILVVLEVILELKPSKITIGDAPIQGCRWDEIVTSEFSEKIDVLSSKYSVPIHIEDFRRRVFNTREGKPVADIRPLSDYLIFDLGKQSLLEPITTTGKTKFRVTDYNSERMNEAHSPGVHKYCLIRDFFESDIIISIPKIKTHEKTGMTGAMKNIVGINGDKDYLPHHRIGGTGNGGDCYPGSNILRYWSEHILDIANKNQGGIFYQTWKKIAKVFWRLSFPQKTHHLSAGWHGNDTTWRMVSDLNKIAVFGKSDNSISEIPQRKIYNICDGIIGGQGNGPLYPDPLPLGVISFSDNAVLNDICFAKLMKLQPEKIPLISNNISEEDLRSSTITYNSSSILFGDLSEFALNTAPAEGWETYLK